MNKPRYVGRDQRDELPSGRDAEGKYHNGYTHTFDSEKMKVSALLTHHRSNQ